MSDKELIYFEILKKEVVKTLQNSHSVNSDIETWKGQEIIYLQDDLSDKVNGRISEKWFYTHIKSNSGKLPRIDMLNILSEYAGYQNWNDLKSQFPQTKVQETPVRNGKKRIILSLILTVILIGIYTGYQLLPKKQCLQILFC